MPNTAIIRGHGEKRAQLGSPARNWRIEMDNPAIQWIA